MNIKGVKWKPSLSQGFRAYRTSPDQFPPPFVHPQYMSCWTLTQFTASSPLPVAVGVSSEENKVAMIFWFFYKFMKGHYTSLFLIWALHIQLWKAEIYYIRQQSDRKQSRGLLQRLLEPIFFFFTVQIRPRNKVLYTRQAIRAPIWCFTSFWIERRFNRCDASDFTISTEAFLGITKRFNKTTRYKSTKSLVLPVLAN